MISLRAHQVTVSGEDFFLAADGEISGPERRRSWHLEPAAYSMMVPPEARRCRRRPGRGTRRHVLLHPRVARVGEVVTAAVSSAPFVTFTALKRQREHDRDDEVEREGRHRDVAHLVEPGDRASEPPKCLPVTGLITW